jgi:hypothetical protein
VLGDRIVYRSQVYHSTVVYSTKQLPEERRVSGFGMSRISFSHNELIHHKRRGLNDESECSIFGAFSLLMRFRVILCFRFFRRDD